MVNKDVEQKFQELLALEENWDSYWSSKISNKAVEAAREAIRVLAEHDPRIVPTSDGGVQIEWHQGNTVIELEFGPDGKLVENY